MATKTYRKGGKVTRSASTTEAEAHCQNCDWSTDAGNAVPQAKVHAQKEGHIVHAAQTIASIWDGTR